MSFRIDSKVSSFVRVGSAVTKAAAQVAPAPLKPLLQTGASAFETARRVLVNLEGGGAPPAPPAEASPDAGAMRVRVTEHAAGPVNFRTGPGTKNGPVEGAPTLAPGTEVDVLKTQRVGGREWMHVRTDDGREGWMVSERSEYVSGIARSHPYVLEDGRDGSGASAVDNALQFVGTREREKLQTMFDAMPEGPNRDALGALLAQAPASNSDNTGNGYAGLCLSFVQDRFGIKQAADRSPWMYNPADSLDGRNPIVPPPQPNPDGTVPKRDDLPYGQVYSDRTDSAYAAWLALENASADAAEAGGSHPSVTRPSLDAQGRADLTSPLPEGAMLYFGPTGKNAHAGHVAIATGVMAPDGTPLLITTTWNNGPVRMMSLAEMEAATGPYLGSTTPEGAFQPGRWGGGSAE